jgi:hypothetical protein
MVVLAALVHSEALEQLATFHLLEHCCMDMLGAELQVVVVEAAEELLLVQHQ